MRVTVLSWNRVLGIVRELGEEEDKARSNKRRKREAETRKASSGDSEGGND